MHLALVWYVVILRFLAQSENAKTEALLSND